MISDQRVLEKAIILKFPPGVWQARPAARFGAEEGEMGAWGRL